MREHEVPTHVQAEDRVLLWFSFPQLVAMTMVAALAYGAYRYAPFGSTEARIGLAVVLGLMGVVMIVGKIGGRRLPLVLADLLKYRLGNRRYAGTPAQLVRPEAPTPSQSKPGSLALLAKRARRIAHRRNGRMPFVPLGLLGKGRRRPAKDRGVKPKRRSRKGKRNKDWRNWMAVLAVAVVAATGAAPLIALADDHHPDGLGFEITEPVPGRRVFIEGLQVTGNSAIVTVRAAADIDLWARTYRGDVLVHRETSWLEEGERKSYILPLSGDAPSLTFSWRDRLRQKGAVTLEGAEIPHPLPSAEGVLCDLTVSSLGWSPGFIVGAVESECEDSLDEVVSLPIVSGHDTVTLDMAEDADVKGITGTVTATVGGSSSTTALVPDATTSFRVEVPVGKILHGVNIEVQAEATLEIDIPPLVYPDSPPGEKRAHNPDGLALPPWCQQDRVQNGGPVPPRRHHHPACHLGHIVRTRRLRVPECDRHRNSRRARAGRGNREGARDPHERRVAGHDVQRGCRRPLRGPQDTGTGSRA